MPNIKSAKKRVKTNLRDTIRNRHYKSMVRTKIKSLQEAIESGDKAKVPILLKDALKTIERVASKGILHKNNAARKKSRLTVKVNKFLASTPIQPSESESSPSV